MSWVDNYLAVLTYYETVAKAFLQFYDRTAQVVWNQFMEAAWNYVTNITKKNQEEMDSRVQVVGLAFYMSKNIISTVTE